jgi:6-phosphogluconolactonase (cycloisomerase 2 family)
MAMHPTGRSLVTVEAHKGESGLTLWRIDQANGRLTAVGAVQHSESCSGMSFSPGGDHLIRISTRSGRIVRTSFDIKSEALENLKAVAHVQVQRVDTPLNLGHLILSALQ